MKLFMMMGNYTRFNTFFRSLMNEGPISVFSWLKSSQIVALFFGNCATMGAARLLPKTNVSWLLILFTTKKGTKGAKLMAIP
jgi:hypothetical protein